MSTARTNHRQLFTPRAASWSRRQIMNELNEVIELHWDEEVSRTEWVQPVRARELTSLMCRDFVDAAYTIMTGEGDDEAREEEFVDYVVMFLNRHLGRNL